jgi:hypothetical protein
MEHHKNVMSSVMKMNDSLGMSKEGIFFYQMVKIHSSEEEEGRQWQAPLPMTRLMTFL